MLLEDAISYFLGLLRAENAPSATIATFHAALSRLDRYAKARKLDRLEDFGPTLVRGCVAAVQDPRQPHGPHWSGGHKMASLVVVAAQSMARRLVSEGLPVSDVSGVRSPRVPERIQTRVTPEEFRAIETAITRRLLDSRQPKALIARDLALIYLMSDCGLRAAELCRLDVADVDTESGELLVYRGKGQKPRALNLSDPGESDGGITLRYLRNWLAHRDTLAPPAQKALWISVKGNRLSPDALRAVLKHACDEAGVDGNRPPHAWRRAYFSEEYRADPLALPILVARMGWSDKSQSMVRIYTRGAQIDLARTTRRPSVAARWRKG